MRTIVRTIMAQRELVDAAVKKDCCGGAGREWFEIQGG
jgi:hypothetical protein